MDIFHSSCHGPQGVDLDDLKTYSGYKWEDWNVPELNAEIRRVTGEALLYMQFLVPEWGWTSSGRSQQERVHHFCFWYAREWREHLTPDTPENRLWFKKFLYRFVDETENMC